MRLFLQWALLIFSLLVSAPTLSNNQQPILDSLLSNNSLIPSQQPKFLPVDQAFKFDFDQQGNTLFTGWEIEPGYYIYKEKLEVIAKGADITLPQLDPGVIIEDEFFGKTPVYFEELFLVSKLSNIEPGAVVKIRYQGCAEAGLCYPPEIITIPLSVSDTSQSQSTTASTSDVQNIIAQEAVEVEPSNDEDMSFTDKLANQSFATNLAVFFIVGVGLAFTPCVFPMFPILSSLIAGQGQLKTKKAFMLSFVYVQGMAITYALLGLVVAHLGGQVQGYIQHPAVLISFSILFVLLAASMFGWYEIKLPSGLVNKLTNVSNKQQGGNYAGVFAMGILSGLIASPCTTAPLSAALLYVAQTGDYLVGGLTLYALSLGMGLPLLALGTSGGKLLPKAGAWMEQVKTLFGFIMLFVPLVLLERILPWDTVLLLAALWATLTAIYLYHWHSRLSPSAGKTSLWAMAMVLMFGAAFTVHSVYAPKPIAHVQETKSFRLIEKSLEVLAEEVALANQSQKIAMVDLYADWCVACKEFEAKTFPKPDVQAEFAHFELLKLDLTDSDDTTFEIMGEFNVLGLPSILFFDKQGNEITELRVAGFMNAEEFSAHLAKVRAYVN